MNRESTPNDESSTASAEPRIVDSLARLLRICVDRDASDLHLAPDLPPYLRVHGSLDPIDGEPALSGSDIASMADSIADGRLAGALASTGSLDGACTAAGARFRYNIFKRQGELSIAVRKLEDEFRTLADLGMPNELYNLCSLPDGLVVVAGPTGAGKSTTLATLIDRINQTRRAHIVTIEDPVEYLHVSAKSLVNQRQVGSDVSSFNDALVASLRQDPDVILVGEIRDLATIRTAITAAETGHLVFTTVHAGDCAGAIERLVSVFPADEQIGIRRQLSLVLRAIIAQHLLISDGDRANNEAPNSTDALPKRHRVAVSEIMMITGAISNLIATGKTAQIYSSMESGAALGMQTMEEHLARLWASGYLSEHTAVGAARNPSIVRERYAKIARRSPPVRTAGGAA